VVEVHLDLQVRLADLLAKRMGVRLPVQEVAGHVAGVDGLDHESAAVFRASSRRVAEVLGEHGAVRGPIGAGRQKAGHRVQGRRAERPRVVQRRRHPAAELGFPAR
jgi:hypothetical protein